MQLQPYLHKVQVYETDMMGITHHASYIHWLEEARIDLMEQLGYSYQRLNEEGVASPVLGLQMDYKAPTTFPDTVRIQPRLLSFNGVILEIGYTLTRVGEDTPVATAVTRHTFTDASGHIVRLKRDHRAFYDMLVQWTEEQPDT